MMTILRSESGQTKTSARETMRESDGEEAGQGAEFVEATALSEASPVLFVMILGETRPTHSPRTLYCVVEETVRIFLRAP